jgi:glycine/D-amino acid oxidase-like deaminating enzyme
VPAQTARDREPDVVVAGNGIVGAAVALRLASAGLRVLSVEVAHPDLARSEWRRRSVVPARDAVTGVLLRGGDIISCGESGSL